MVKDLTKLPNSVVANILAYCDEEYKKIREYAVTHFPIGSNDWNEMIQAANGFKRVARLVRENREDSQ